jgi:hypothetical protein
MKKSLLIVVASLCVFGARAAEPYGGLFAGQTGLETAASDFITLRKTADKLWLEIPTRYLGRRMLIGSTLSDISAPMFGDVGFKQQTPMHIAFSLRDTTLHMHRVNTSFTTDFMDRALERVNRNPIWFSFPVVARGEGSGAGGGSVVVEMSSFFLDNPSFFSFFPEGGIDFTPTLKPESSSLDGVKAWSDNCAIKCTLSFTVSADAGGAQLASDSPVTAVVTRSILLLPEQEMIPRVSDSRVGVFSTEKTRYSIVDEGSRSYSVANRWRVVPRDVEAYTRGEAVEPVKPIVWYIDPAFPDNWKPALKRAVERWNAPFEAIGFRNVLQARPFPTADEDPAFDPDNLKYSCMRFLPSPTVNAMGPSWVDPMTGEIISASVIVWSDIAKLANQWRFVQTAQIDPRVRTKKLPDDIFDETLEYIVGHEVGHTLGFAHNMAASSAWPVDSLRSPSFTRKFGTTPSIMDYARFNYVAQPGDSGVRLTPPVIGVHDNYLVRWTYQYVPGMRSEWEEAPIVERWVDAVAGDPVYRYGRQQFGAARYDPSAIEEDLGNDPMRAGDYGIANLKYILPQLERWIVDDADYSHRSMLYGEICDQYFRYLRAVMMNVGGIYLTDVKQGTKGEHIVPVDRDVQRQSLRWVMDQFRDMDWLDQPSLTRNFELDTRGSSKMYGRVTDEMSKMIPRVVLSSHYAGLAAPVRPGAGTRAKNRIETRAGYTVEEFMDDLFHETWRNIRANRMPTRGELILQKNMVDMFCEPLKSLGGEGSSSAISATSLREGSPLARQTGDFRFGPGGTNTQDEVDISSIDDSADYLMELAIRSRDLLERASRHPRHNSHVHYHALLMKLNAALANKYQ